MNQNIKSKSGFTIIEVVLVLAIAGLIFLIVFLAVPALQRSQRDTQRRNDANRLLTYVSNYQSNNRGTLPTTAAQQSAFETGYLKELTSPSTGAAYTVVWGATAPTLNTATGVETLQIAVGQKCSGDAITAGTGRNVAVRTVLEGGGYHCTDQ